MLTAIYAIIIFSVIIFVHEFGHFIFAKLFNVYVSEFAIGMGPIIFKKQKGETLYSIRAIPMGGFCQLEGENGESESPRSFGKKSKLQRFIILSAGSFMNLILGFVIVILMTGLFGADKFATTTIDSILENTPAYEAGMLPGDKVISLNGERVNINSDFQMYNNLSDLDIKVKRGSEILSFTITPKTYLLNENGDIIEESTSKEARRLIGIKFGSEDKTFFTTLKNSFFESILIGKIVFISLKGLTTGEIPADSLSGPVGIVNEINTAAKHGIDYILYIMALITINLGIFNLLPLPALDGGRIVFILIEAVIRKPVSPKYEGVIHTIGFILLILLMLYATGNDFLRIFKN